MSAVFLLTGLCPQNLPAAESCLAYLAQVRPPHNETNYVGITSNVGDIRVYLYSFIILVSSSIVRPTREVFTGSTHAASAERSPASVVHASADDPFQRMRNVSKICVN